MAGVNKVILIGNLGKDPEIITFETAKKATERTKIQLALNMIKDGNLSVDQIAKYTMLEVDKIKELTNLQPV